MRTEGGQQFAMPSHNGLAVSAQESAEAAQLFRKGTTPQGGGLVIVGGGPAGLAPLFAAAAAGRLPELLEASVTLVERGEQMGAGALHDYAIQSDSTAAAFLAVLQGSTHPELRSLVQHPAALELERRGQGEAPLALVATWLQAISDVLRNLVLRSRHGRVLTQMEAISVRQAHDGGWITHVRHPKTGIAEEIASHRVLLATGAHQPVDRLLRERFAGTALLPRYGHKLIQSGVVLSHGGAQIVASRLRGLKSPRVAILGGSTSAAAAAVLLLQHLPEVIFGPAAIQLLHRKAIRICYDSQEEAVAAGDTNFTADDICPLTHRVNRFSGLRLSSRELLMRVQGLGGSVPEPRLTLLPLQDGREAEVRPVLDQADLIIAALGYRPLLLPVLDAFARPVPLHQPTTADWTAVDRRFRVRTLHGGVLEGLLATGLAVGPVPDRGLGGELGFTGQVNSLWMWQHSLGLRLLREILAPAARVRYRGMIKTFPLPLSRTTPHVAAQGGVG